MLGGAVEAPYTASDHAHTTVPQAAVKNLKFAQQTAVAMLDDNCSHFDSGFVHCCGRNSCSGSRAGSRIETILNLRPEAHAYFSSKCTALAVCALYCLL
jgi:hypothetical protein